ncbi:hypothetical protein FGB62_24g026 [Gracilaria domingensis]|nr:hypothetical protein FGB62_24g026 [Gracilaria domingensis]
MEGNGDRIPDGVLAFIAQLILGIALATSAVPPTVLSLQDRGSETMGVLIVLVVTAVSALPLRNAFGTGDFARSEYLLAALAPFVARVDLTLVIWVSVNKSLLWAEQMLFTTQEELQCVGLLVLASTVWHDGDNRLYDPEFGYYGGEAGALTYSLLRDYHPRNAMGTLLPLIGHITLYPIALVFHILLQIIAAIGFVPFWFLAMIARICNPIGEGGKLKSRGPVLHFLLRRRSSHSCKLFLRKEVAAVFDANQQLLTAPSRVVRHRWAMLGNLDSITQHSHFSRLYNVCYPMRATQVLQRVHQDHVCNDIMKLRNKEDVLFRDYTDKPIVSIGEAASKQIILYRVMSWPESTEYSRLCYERLQQFVDENIRAWKETEERLADDERQLSEFISVRHVLRRVLVQLIMLGWWDGLGECRNSGVFDVPVDLARHFLKAGLQSIEMVVRLSSLESRWNDEYQASSMILALRCELGVCSCDVCSEMAALRRITDERYGSEPTGEQMAEQLRAIGCSNADAIESVWREAVLKWTHDLFGVASA